MTSPALCKICGVRKAKRNCLAVGSGICTLCCGTEREVSLSCPLECEYLQDAHTREKTIPIEQKDIPSPDITVTEEFVAAHEELVLFAVYSLLQATLRTPGAVDGDVLAALSALTQTHRTLEAGLVYETLSPNALAVSIQRRFSASLEDYQKLRREREALTPLRNSEILATLVFLHRVGQQNQNGRPRGRMFIDLLRHMTPDTPVDEPAPSLII
jgi:hypothetical protein